MNRIIMIAESTRSLVAGMASKRGLTIPQQPKSSLLETRRVLMKNGLIVIGTPNRLDPLYETLQFIADKTHKKMPIIGYPDKTHRKLFTLPTLKALFRACGFYITHVKVQYSLLGMKTFGGDLVVSAVKTK